MNNTELQIELELLKALRKKSEEQEKIVYLSSEDDSSQFFVTETETFTYKGVLQSCEWKGYIVLGDIQQIVKMRCSIKYDAEHKYLNGVFLQDIVVDLRWQGKGYGSRMLHLLIRYAEKLGAEYLSGELSFVDVGTENDPQRKEKTERLSRFYRRHGFTVCENKHICRCIEKSKP